MNGCDRPGTEFFESHDGVRLGFYDNHASGRPVIFLHGLLVDSEMNYGLDAYQETGWRVILLDARGHGISEKPREGSAYAERSMAKDVLALIKHLGLKKPIVIGYSLGANTAMEAALIEQANLGGLVLGGIGNDEMPEVDYRKIADEMRANPAPADGYYRSLADELGADREAIAAWAKGAVLPQIPADADLSGLALPVLVVNGDQDAAARPLAERIPGSRVKTVPGDHLSALAHPEFSSTIVAFVNGVSLDSPQPIRSANLRSGDVFRFFRG